MLKAANNAQSVLAQAIDATATSFGVIDGSSFPDGNFLISADDEIMLVGTRSGNAFSDVTRGYEGTTAASHVSGTAVENKFTAGTYTQLADALVEHKNDTVQDVDGAHGLTVEGGTWTPTLIGTTVAGNHTYSSQYGAYVKQGNVVYIRAMIVISTKDENMSGQVQIGGIPYSQIGDPRAVLNVLCRNINLDAATISLECITSNDVLILTQVRSGTRELELDSSAILNGTFIRVAGCYSI